MVGVGRGTISAGTRGNKLDRGGRGEFWWWKYREIISELVVRGSYVRRNDVGGRKIGSDGREMRGKMAVLVVGKCWRRQQRISAGKGKK